MSSKIKDFMGWSTLYAKLSSSTIW